MGMLMADLFLFRLVLGIDEPGILAVRADKVSASAEPILSMRLVSG